MRTLPVGVLVAVVLAVAVAGVAPPAHAQVISRDKKTPQTQTSDDDDILAPKNDKKLGDKGGDQKPTDKPTEAAPKGFSVGLVAIVPVGEAGKTLADKVTTGLQKELGAGRDFDAVPLAVDIKGAAVTPATDEAAGKAALADGTATLQKAKKALENLKFGVAKKGFEQALDSLEKAAPVMADPGLLIDARLGLAEVAARQGQDSESEAQLALAAALNPENNLDKKRFPGAFITTFLKQRERILAKDKRGTVVVDSSASGASVEVDGRAIQGAPCTITGVPEGRHLLRVVREGLPSWGAVVEVKANDTQTLSPGFIAKDGKSWIDNLQNNRLGPDAAKAIAEAARAKNQKGAVVGVVAKQLGNAPTQLVLVDAATGGMIKLPTLAFTETMLDIGIETLKARDAIEAALGADAKPTFSSDAIAVVLEGAKAGAAADMATVALRYDVQPLKTPTRSRLVTDDKKPEDTEIATADDENGDHKVLSAGKSGTRKRLDEDEDPYAHSSSSSSSSSGAPDPDAPLTEQPWFWPTVIGGGAGAVVVLGGATVVTLIAAKVLPDPRPTSGATVHVALP